ncbi:MAG: prolipoprotein diacylglyceryl transferase [Bacilli bacterium]|nr:prolipoprotein diacylglyceryl transferase [Bacilli bacterium]
MDAVLIEIGPITIYWYSIMILLGMLIGGTLAIKEAEKFKISEEFMINLAFFLIPISFIGARIYYIIFDFAYYKNNIIDIFKIWEGGIAIHGGIIAGLIFIIIYTKKYKVNTLKLLDILVVGLIIAQAIGRWGNFFNQEAYGSATTLSHLQSLHIPNFIIERMYINGVYYTPTFLYESIWCVIGFIVLLFVRRYKYIKNGQITAIYMIYYSIGRFFIEGMRLDSLMFNNIRVAQLVSFLLIVIGIIMFIFLGRGSKLENRYNEKENLKDVMF